MVWALIPAAGRGVRAGLNQNKLFEPIGGVPVLVRTLRAFETAPRIDAVCVACAHGEIETVKAMVRTYGLSKTTLFVEGGATRQESVYRALSALPKNTGTVLIHDGARPFVSQALIEHCIDGAGRYGACIPVLPLVDTVKIVLEECVQDTPQRETLYRVQTPQAFDYWRILHAHEQAAEQSLRVTDDASVVEQTGGKVYCIPGEESNGKLTTRQDFEWANARFEPPRDCELRIGYGYDAHRLVPGRKLVLCGVQIPYERGLLGHSDADVATHALMDAMLGACGAGDIGMMFPDHDERYRDINSQCLLTEVVERLRVLGWTLSNADVTIVAQRPKLAPFRSQMQQTLAQTLQCGREQVSVKATTTERMGFEGREEGISAMAVVLMARIKEAVCSKS